MQLKTKGRIVGSVGIILLLGTAIITHEPVVLAGFISGFATGIFVAIETIRYVFDKIRNDPAMVIQNMGRHFNKFQK